MTFDEFILLLGNLKDTPKQITDRHEVTCWTDGDWKEYYYVFEIGGDLRAEIVDGYNHIWFGLFTWEYLNEHTPKFWHDIIKDKDERVSYDELVNILSKIGVKLDAPEVYKNNKTN